MRRQPAFSLSYAHQIMQPGMRSAFQPVTGLPQAMTDLIDRIGGAPAAAPSLAGRLEAIKGLIDAEEGAGRAVSH